MIRRSAPVRGERHVKTVTFEVRQANDERRTIEHVITRRLVDRDGDVVEPGGARIENYRKNPVVLFGHFSFGFPIGQNLELAISREEIVAVTQFAGLDQASEEAERAYRLARDGFLRAWSIGFMPITWSEDRAFPEQTGWWFKEWELMEYSLVALPSNPAALSRMAKAYGLPPGATELDLADAVRRDRQPYWDIAASLATAKTLIAVPEDTVHGGDLAEGLKELSASVQQLSQRVAKLEAVTKPETLPPDDEGHCPDGYEMGDDGMCHEKTKKGCGCTEKKAVTPAQIAAWAKTAMQGVLAGRTEG